MRALVTWSSAIFVSAWMVNCASTSPMPRGPQAAPTSSRVPPGEADLVDTEAASTARTPSVSPVPTGVEPQPGAPGTVEVSFLAKSGSKLAGRARLVETPEGVRVQIEVENVKPGAHAVHVHETGDCSARDASSAGEHYNPTHHRHGLPSASEKHLGDMGNLTASEAGNGALDFVLEGASLKPDAATSVLGRAIIIHEKLDDGGQPSGNAGGRIGCAEIRAASAH